MLNTPSLEEDEPSNDSPDHSGFTIEADLVDYIEIQDENRSNRIKYTCPNCSVNVWGKPNIRIMCGKDKCGSVLFITN